MTTKKVIKNNYIMIKIDEAKNFLNPKGLFLEENKIFSKTVFITVSCVLLQVQKTTSPYLLYWESQLFSLLSKVLFSTQRNSAHVNSMKPPHMLKHLVADFKT